MIRSLLDYLFTPAMKNPSDPKPVVSAASDERPQRVTGSNWDVHPIGHPATATWHLGLSSTDVAKLLNGYQPSAMEDRWMCRSDGPDDKGKIVVHVYRSWTGHEQFQIMVSCSGPHPAAICGAESEATEAYGAGITDITWDAGSAPTEVSEDEAKKLAINICRRVLGCELEMAP